MTTLRTPKVTIYRSPADNQWRWRWVSANGLTLADSGQGYARKADAINGLKLVAGATYDADMGVLSHNASSYERVHVEVLP